MRGWDATRFCKIHFSKSIVLKTLIPYLIGQATEFVSAKNIARYSEFVVCYHPGLGKLVWKDQDNFFKSNTHCEEINLTKSGVDSSIVFFMSLTLNTLIFALAFSLGWH